MTDEQTIKPSPSIGDRGKSMGLESKVFPYLMITGLPETIQTEEKVSRLNGLIMHDLPIILKTRDVMYALQTKTETGDLIRDIQKLYPEAGKVSAKFKELEEI